jgi:hypothetical protein
MHEKYNPSSRQRSQAKCECEIPGMTDRDNGAGFLSRDGSDGTEISVTREIGLLQMPSYSSQYFAACSKKTGCSTAFRSTIAHTTRSRYGQDA